MGAGPYPASAFLVEFFFNGFYASALLVTIWVILVCPRYSRGEKFSVVSLLGFMYFCSTVHSGLHWSYFSQAINDNELSGGPGLLNGILHFKPWIEAVGDTFFTLNIFLADSLFVWRCWLVWQRRWAIVVLPAIATIVGAVLAGLVIAAQVSAEHADVPTTVIKKTHDFVTFNTAYFALSMTTSLMTTLLIAIRIRLVQKSTKEAGIGNSNAYSRAVEILVESAILYSTSLLIFVILNSRKSINLVYAQNIHAQVTGFAPMLIILRASSGYSRRDWSAKSTLPYWFGGMRVAEKRTKESGMVFATVDLTGSQSVGAKNMVTGSVSSTTSRSLGRA